MVEWGWTVKKKWKWSLKTIRMMYLVIWNQEKQCIWMNSKFVWWNAWIKDSFYQIVCENVSMKWMCKMCIIGTNLKWWEWMTCW